MGVYDHDLSTIEWLNRAAGELGEGFLVFDMSYGFPVRYGCLLWEVYIGEYCEVLGEGPSWNMLPDQIPAGVVTATSQKQARQYIQLDDGYPVNGTWGDSHPLPTKVYAWMRTADREGMTSVCAVKVPDLRAQVLQAFHRLVRQTAAGQRWEGWPWRSPPEIPKKPPDEPPPPPKPPDRVQVSNQGWTEYLPPDSRCKTCRRRFGTYDGVIPIEDSYRHARCLPPLRLVQPNGETANLYEVERDRPCPICGRLLHSPLGGAVHRHGNNYRHASCSVKLKLKSGRQVFAAAGSLCRVCKQALEPGSLVTRTGSDIYRHADCPLPIEVTYRCRPAVVSGKTVCLVCRKPISGRIVKFDFGYRHADCPPSPAYTLDRRGRPVYRQGYRREDGVWVCPPGAALSEYQAQVTVRPRNRSWIPRHPMLDEGEEYQEEHSSSSSGWPAAFWWN
ncbi:MAG: hypothetical protein ACE5F6_00420 [Anaerolineae bacterium]